MTRKKVKAKVDTIPVNDEALRRFVGYNLKRAYMTVRHDFIETLEQHDMRITSFSALVLIIDRPDMTQSQLAEALSIERSGVVLLVDELESKELINRNRVEGDRRTYALRATLKGVQFGEKIIAATEAHEERMLKGLTTEQRKNLVDILNTIENQRTAKS